MFNRTIQLDVVKKNVKNEATPVSDEDISHYVAAAAVAGQQIVYHGIKLVAAYMVLDTARKIAVNRLSK